MRIAAYCSQTESCVPSLGLSRPVRVDNSSSIQDLRQEYLQSGAARNWGCFSQYEVLGSGRRRIWTYSRVAIATASQVAEPLRIVKPRYGPVTLLCRPKCSFKLPSARRRQGFSSPVLRWRSSNTSMAPTI